MRKRILLATILTILIITGCVTTESLPGSKTFTKFDFSKYSEKGFLFTPEGYNDDYQSIGMINITFWPEVLKKGDKPDPAKSYRTTFSAGNRWFIERLNMQTAIDSMYSKATEMGADAVIRFNANYKTKRHAMMTIVGIDVTGFAIKRTD